MSTIKLGVDPRLPAPEPVVKPSRRGFAALSVEKRREMASRGGKAVHEQKKAPNPPTEVRAAAGRKGGKRTQELGKGHRFDSEEAGEVSRKFWGGIANNRKKT